MKPRSLAGVLLAGLSTSLIALISTGFVRVPLPAPAQGRFVNLVPAGVLPWRPQPLKDCFKPNKRLLSAVRLFDGQVHGAESVAFFPSGNLALLDRSGSLYEALLESGCGNGRGSSVISDASTASSGVSPVANDEVSFVLNPSPLVSFGAGRPLGYHVDNEENLIVANSLKGLLKFDTSTRETVILANRVSLSSPIDPGSEITYANDLAIASDGRIYFTSSSDITPARNAPGPAGYWDTFGAWVLGLAQGLPRGRLLMHDPATGETVVLAKGFYYANGVALSEDESYLVIAETDRIRLLKYWLEGPKAGTSEPLIENLPGAPDGVSTAGGSDCFWVGLVSPVPPIARLLRDPTVRALFAWLPKWARPGVKKWGAALKVSGDGRVRDWLMDPAGEHVSSVSSAVEHDGCLFLGNLMGSSLAYVDLGTGGAESDCTCTCNCGPDTVHTRLKIQPPPPPPGEGGDGDGGEAEDAGGAEAQGEHQEL